MLNASDAEMLAILGDLARSRITTAEVCRRLTIDRAELDTLMEQHGFALHIDDVQRDAEALGSLHRDRSQAGPFTWLRRLVR